MRHGIDFLQRAVSDGRAISLDNGGKAGVFKSVSCHSSSVPFILHCMIELSEFAD